MSDRFWALSESALFEKYKSNPNGLTVEQAATLLNNRTDAIVSSKNEDWMLLLGQFKSPIVLLLLFAATLSVFLGEHLDSGLIFAIVFISGALSFYQERGARNAIASMLKVIETHCRVIRAGSECDMPSKNVVVGDILLLSAGATIPADCRILESKELFVDEASLTGETFPVEKHAGVIEDDPISSRTNCVFSGTHVVSGTAKVLVVSTGKNTEFGKASARISSKSPETDFERGIRLFGFFLMEITLLLVLAIFAINVFMHRPVLQSFTFSLALAVGLTPQLLPAIISINLAIGAKKMAQSKVIVKRLAAIESFGSMNVLCSDKTGTLTEGTVRLEASLDVEGRDSAGVKLLSYLNASMETGFANPIDMAIRLQKDIDTSAYKKLDEIPYDFNRKRLTVMVHKDNEDHNLIVSKGAFKNVLDVCSQAEVAGKVVPIAEVRTAVEEKIAAVSLEGKRVLAVATRKIAEKNIKSDCETDMTLVGFLVFSDPPKTDINKTIADLNALGVRLKVITGDNHLVATALAKKIGFLNPVVVSAQDFRDMKSEALTKIANEADVFAEVEPNQKEQIILALRRSGNVVGYIGDGINDAPALHAADIGISVNNAVDVAKEAAQLVMLEHDLNVLVAGIREGRKTFANTIKYIFMATSANFGNMFSMAGASLFLPFLPLLPHQILLTNLLTDVPEMTIATDSVDAEAVDSPMHWNVGMIRSFMLTFGGLSSVFDFSTFYVLYVIMHASPAQFRSCWFIESVVSAALIVLVIRTRRSIHQSRPSPPLAWATGLVVLTAIVFPFTAIAGDIGFAPPPPVFLLYMAGIVLAYIFCAEALKGWFYRKRHA